MHSQRQSVHRQVPQEKGNPQNTSKVESRSYIISTSIVSLVSIQILFNDQLQFLCLHCQHVLINGFGNECHLLNL